MKALTRNLEVCDLLDMRNVQTVAEHAPKITSFLLEEEKQIIMMHVLASSVFQKQIQLFKIEIE